MKPYVAGTRKSDLAMWQTHWAQQLLQDAVFRREGNRIEVQLCPIVTRGDKDLSSRLAGKLEKGFFTQELEAALRSGEIDFAVHSLKDLPTQLAPDLCIAAILPRANAADWLIALPSAVDKDAPPTQLPLVAKSRVGSSSVRREALLGHFGSLLQTLPLRGNVPTRLKKLYKGQYEAIVVAAAGVIRLQAALASFVVFELNPRRWTPAPGQGAVAIQCRAEDAALKKRLQLVSDAATQKAVELERAYLRVLEGGCTTPFGCWYDGARVHLGLEVGNQWRSAHLSPPLCPEESALLSQLHALNAGAPPSSPPYKESSNDCSWLYQPLSSVV